MASADFLPFVVTTNFHPLVRSPLAHINKKTQELLDQKTEQNISRESEDIFPLRKQGQSIYEAIKALAVAQPILISCLWAE